MQFDITILIASYNNEPLISRAVRSCLGQLILRSTIQIIVIDDCSSDNTFYRLQEFSDNIEIIQNDENEGIGSVSVKGLEKAKGQYFLRLDADDFLSQHHCAFHKQILDYNPAIAFSYSDLIEVNDYLQKKNEPTTFPDDMSSTPILHGLKPAENKSD